MKIALDVRPLLGHARAGVYHYTASLIEALGDVELPGELVLWCTMRTRSARARAFGPDLARLAQRHRLLVARCPNALLYTPAALQTWSRWPRSAPVPELLPPDVGLFHAPFWPVPLSRRTPMVLTVHDLLPHEHPRWFTRRQWTEFRSVLQLAGRAAHVIADSAATKLALLRHTTIAADNVTVVPLAADPLFSLPRDPARTAAVLAQYGISPPYIVSLGTVEPRKNVGRLLAAYELLHARGESPPPLVLVGSMGWNQDDAAKALTRLQEQHRTLALGHVPREHLPHLLGAAELLAYVSLGEGFGLPPLEAMAVGTPVLTSNVSSLPEVVGEAALQVDPLSTEAIAEGLRRLLSDRTLAREFAERGRQRAAEFTWSRTAEQTAQVYRRVLVNAA